MDKNSNDDSIVYKSNHFNLPANIEQVVMVTAVAGKSTGHLYAYQKTEDNEWLEVFNSVPVVIGKAGMASDKIEGDNKSPLGLHKIGYAFGIDEKPKYIKLPYKEISSSDKFIDDPEHADYNTWVEGDTDAASYEKMKRKDDSYDLGLVIEYNMNPVVPSKGSAIFVHIWRSSEKGTEGCVAMRRSSIEKLLAWLDPKYSPYLYILES